MTSQTWQHQKPAIDFLSQHNGAVVDAWMGTGKSFIGMSSLARHGSGPRAFNLIVCPSAVLGVWRGQFEKHFPDQFDVLVLQSGNTDSKAEALQKFRQRAMASSRPAVCVVNYETVWREPLFTQICSSPFDVMVLDEIHKIKSPSQTARASHGCWRIGKLAQRRIGLTGTLMPHSPLDVFAQYRFLDESVFGRFITRFREKYCVMDPRIQGRILKFINQDEMIRRVNMIRYHIPSSVLVLPEKQEIRVDVPLSASGMRAYKSMLRDSQVEIAKQIEQASLSGASYQEVIHTVSAMNGGIRFLRLLQLAQGYANDENGEEVQTDTEKRRALLDMLEQTDEPVCVYGWFKHDLKTVRDCCEILGRSYGEVSGVRKDLTDRGTMPEVDVLGVQCKSGNSGIDLTRARIAIVLNTGTMSPGDYDQMLARQYRPGQTRGVVYYHLVTPGTVDEYAYTARQEKRDVVDAILRGIVPDEWAELEGRFSCLAS